MVTPSRRTPQESLTAFRRALGDCHHFIWNELGDNPYYGFLALGDIVIVTNDSVSMLSEAASLGKPLYTFALRGAAGVLTCSITIWKMQALCARLMGF
ncbi:MAG: mitochondrial fission ELM1 family protein [Holosporaceae bacterium]|nr:MAG: mitochondrial fission ELM1 family protein [Holosporaceae bacterium]